MNFSDVEAKIRDCKIRLVAEGFNRAQAHAVAVAIVAEALAEQANLSGGEFRSLLADLSLEEAEE